MKLETFPTNEKAKEMLDMVNNGFYDKSYVGKWIFQVMGTEMQQAENYVMELQQQISPYTATWGLMYHEMKYGLIGIGNLENRRNRLFMKITNTMPFSPAMLIRNLSIVSSLDEKDFTVVENVADYTFEVGIQSYEVPIDIKTIRNYILHIKPSHLHLQICEIYKSYFYQNVKTDSSIKVHSVFYPRGNFKFLMLDGTWRLNGTHTLNGYFDNHVIDFYPIQLEVSASIGVKKEISTLMETSSNAINEIQYEEELEIDSKINVEKQEESKLCLYSNTMLQIGIKSEVTIEKHIKYLDGTWLLNGTKLLDAEIIKIEL